jgi:predicted transcriptional regulator
MGEGVGQTQGRIPTFNRKYEIQHLQQRHHEIIRLSTLGHGNKEIAQILGITPQTVSICLNSKLARDKMDHMRQERDAATVDVATAIADLAPKAAKMVDVILSRDLGVGVSPSTQLKAAMDILDRNGYKPPEKHQHVHAHLTSEEVEAIKKRALEFGLSSGKVINGSSE